MSDSGAAWTIKRLLEWTAAFFTRKQVDSPRLSSELLLAHVLGVHRIKLYTDYQRVVSESHLAAFRALVQRAGAHEPIAYLTGVGHFFSLEFEVTHDVLIPRPDTETLVENVIQLARHEPGMESPRVLDLCTGSGCIAIAVAHHLKRAVVTAIDISPAAVEVARRNARRLGVGDRLSIETGDLYEPLSRMVDAAPFQIITANPPYIPTAALASLDRAVRDHEPITALDGGPDGLTVHRRILAGAAGRLTPGGRIFLEIAFDQASAATALAGEFDSFADVRTLRDYGGKDRVITARRK